MVNHNQRQTTQKLAIQVVFSKLDEQLLKDKNKQSLQKRRLSLSDKMIKQKVYSPLQHHKRERYKKSLNQYLNKQQERQTSLKAKIGFNSQIFTKQNDNLFERIISAISQSDRHLNSLSKSHNSKIKQEQLLIIPKTKRILQLIGGNKLQRTNNRTINQRLSTEVPRNNNKKLGKKEKVNQYNFLTCLQTKQHFAQYKEKDQLIWNKINRSCDYRNNLPALNKQRQRYSKQQYMTINCEPWETAEELATITSQYKKSDLKKALRSRRNRTQANV